MSDATQHSGFLAPDPTYLGPLFPGYEITGLIACGGMGAVYHAVQRSLERDVAIKILPREFSKDTSFCAGFEAEAKAMARLNHPNLIGVYDFGEVDGMLFIIMEFVPGQSLFHSADGVQLDPMEVIRLVSGICNGLAHAHQNGIIHRDIKPANILLDLNGEPKIGDFGLARPLDRKIEEGEDVFGTPHYTAPEVIHAPNSVDARADIFSLGVMLHELLTGTLPANDPRPASAIALCDPRFDAIIRRATHPSPDARYANAMEMAGDLAKIATSYGPRVLQTAASVRRVPTLTPRVQPRLPVRKSSSSPVPMIVMLLVAIAGAAWLLVKKSSRNTAPPPTVIVEQPAPRPVVEPPLVESQPAPVKKPTLRFPDPPPVTQKDPDEDQDDLWDDDDNDDAPVTGQTTPESDFDMDAFYHRAHTVMRDLARPLKETHRKSLQENIQSFKEDTIRFIERMQPRGREFFIARMDKYITVWTAENRLPEILPREVDLHIDFARSFERHLERQISVDKKLETDLAGLLPTYILGLKKQIERFEADGDQEGIRILKEEIERAQTDPAQFRGILTPK
jgi:serine/threonine protein kinase